jgi:hypothetical protein
MCGPSLDVPVNVAAGTWVCVLAEAAAVGNRSREGMIRVEVLASGSPDWTSERRRWPRREWESHVRDRPYRATGSDLV